MTCKISRMADTCFISKPQNLFWGKCDTDYLKLLKTCICIFAGTKTPLEINRYATRKFISFL
jgi:hypothetical protein